MSTSQPPAIAPVFADVEAPRRGAPKDDPLIQAVLAAPRLQRPLTDEEKTALEEYRQTKRARGA